MSHGLPRPLGFGHTRVTYKTEKGLFPSVTCTVISSVSFALHVCYFSCNQTNTTLNLVQNVIIAHVWIETRLKIYLYMLLLLLSRFSHVQLCVTPETAAHRLPHPCDSPGKNTGVGCHFLLQCMKVKSESEVAQSCPTPIDPVDCSLPGSSIHGIFQARVLEWGAIAFSIIHAIQTQFYKSAFDLIYRWENRPGKRLNILLSSSGKPGRREKG